ncbi:MAG: hypothetical protein WCP96_20360, partial [Methylococcaceae bacterium]
MTAQISDQCLFKRRTYDLIGVDGGELASPEQFGMEPEMMDTSCYRGFYANSDTLISTQSVHSVVLIK